ncbi:MAG: hypothetical protein DHS20C01_12560 [marine bacterium B5-7]|nr:MAG: hypothetical protein DHS20C01_12560 [marine bacterium B5-7]
MGHKSIDGALRRAILAGKPPDGVQIPGRTVCACHNVGEKTLISIINENQLDSADAVGAVTRAGTGCGSCIPEIESIIGTVRKSGTGGARSLSE